MSAAWATVSAVDLPVALALVVALVGVATVLGVLFQRSQGRLRRRDATGVAPAEAVDPTVLESGPLGDEATLLQFSTEMCARCPGVHRMLSTVADARDGVRHLDVDLTHRPDLARRFRVLQTPTTLVLDRRGVERSRFGGPPSRTAVEAELTRLTQEARRG